MARLSEADFAQGGGDRPTKSMRRVSGWPPTSFAICRHVRPSRDRSNSRRFASSSRLRMAWINSRSSTCYRWALAAYRLGDILKVRDAPTLFAILRRDFVLRGRLQIGPESPRGGRGCLSPFRSRKSFSKDWRMSEGVDQLRARRSKSEGESPASEMGRSRRGGGRPPLHRRNAEFRGISEIPHRALLASGPLAAPIYWGTLEPFHYIPLSYWRSGRNQTQNRPSVGEGAAWAPTIRSMERPPFVAVVKVKRSIRQFL